MVVSKPLYVALAQRKEDRRARLQVCFDFVLNLPRIVVQQKSCLDEQSKITMFLCNQSVAISIGSQVVLSLKGSDLDERMRCTR
jgi:hypothetical protein